MNNNSNPKMIVVYYRGVEEVYLDTPFVGIKKCNTSFSINSNKLTLVLTLSGNFRSCARISETARQN